ncbi:MAG: hypothetical protein ACXWB9_02195 [Flavisolibacter sp.]
MIEQKTESGKQIPEGTVYFDSSTSTLSVALGKKYDDADPIAVFNLAGDAQLAGEAEVKVKTKKGSTKSKTKLVIYNASKADQSTTSANLNSSK